MAWGRRCDLGCESWPDSDDYKNCPLCGEEATRYSNLKPMDPEEARAMVSKIKFEEFYDNRCRRLNITSEGPFKRRDTGEELVLLEEGEFIPAAQVAAA